MGGKGSGGHNRRPTEVRRALGDPGHKGLPDESKIVLLPSASESHPTPPRPLGKHGRDEWNRALDHASAWLAESDLATLLLYCETHDEYQQWRIEAIRSGDWRAQLRVDELRKQLIVLASELGLSPIGRSRLGVAEVRMREGLAAIAQGRTAAAAEF